MSEESNRIPIPAETDDRAARSAALREELEQRVLVLDGATGTALQAENLGPEDFGGPNLEGCNENLCRTRPDVIERIHGRYLEAGADIVETNSFGGTPLVLDEYGLGEVAFELNRLSAALARKACRAFEQPGRLAKRRAAHAQSAQQVVLGPEQGPVLRRQDLLPKRIGGPLDRTSRRSVLECSAHGSAPRSPRPHTGLDQEPV